MSKGVCLMIINYEKEHLAEDLRNSMQELSVKINLKHYDLQRANNRLREALESQESDKIEMCLQDMNGILNQIKTWEIELEGCTRLARKISKRMNGEISES